MRLASFILAIAPAIAIPASSVRAEPCAVTIARAPDDVRATIDAWVAAEPRCARSLEVRVVPAAMGGFYLYARDAGGRVRERIVPDAQSAGVLVASWVADDVPAPVRMPSAVPIPEAPGVVATAAPVGHGNHGISLDVAAATGTSRGAALRADIELQHRGWLVYGAASIGRTRLAYYDSTSTIGLYPLDTRAALGIGHAWGTGRWQLRLRAGVQYARWEGDFSDTIADSNIHSQFVGIESSLLLARAINPRWSVTGGLDGGGFLGQRSGPFSVMIYGPAIELGILGGLRARL